MLFRGFFWSYVTHGREILMHFVQEDGGNGEMAYSKELEMRGIFNLHVRYKLKDGRFALLAGR